jgi:hypothetical protein
MNEVYRKWGRVVRYENGMTIRVEESGEATEDGDIFHAAPVESRVALPEPDLECGGRAAARGRIWGLG